MISSLLKRLTKRLPPPRIIWDSGATGPYMSRWHLWGTPKMPDGTIPWNSDGSMKAGHINHEGWSVFLHCFHRGDVDRDLHNHPWAWGLSLMLARGYREERLDKDGKIVSRNVKPWRLNIITKKTFHRVDLDNGEAWSLILVGPKFQKWGFWERDNHKFVPWREYIDKRQGSTA